MLNTNLNDKALATLRGCPSFNFVFFFNGEICSVSTEFTKPESFVPGVIAVDRVGNQWEAQFGDSYNGAQKWTNILDIHKGVENET